MQYKEDKNIFYLPTPMEIKRFVAYNYFDFQFNLSIYLDIPVLK